MKKPEKPMPRCIISIAVLFFLAGTAFADSVDVEYVDRECVVGESLFFNVKITVEDDKGAGKQIDVSKVMLNGKPLNYEIRETGSQSFTVVMNGRTIRNSSGIVKNYIFEIPAGKVGKLILPSFEIKVGEKSYTSKPLEFRVLQKPTSANLVFKTIIKHPQPFYYPTQVIKTVNKIYYREFPGSPSIENIHLPILKHKGFSLILKDGADWEAVINKERFGIKPIQGTQVLNGKKYNFFAFDLEFRLMESGTFIFENFIKMQVETGRVTRQPGFFGSQIVKEKRALFADCPPFKIVVRQLPKAQVPPSFNGAIGDFKIKAIPSSDTDVKVGDPITLAIEITGRGTWEFVKSPPIDKISEFTDYFKISKDPVTGEVSSDGSSKTFLVRMRVKSKTVKEIPPIPFTFFNLVKEKYVTIYSDPVPISVFDTAGKVSVVDFSHRVQEEAEQKPSEEKEEKLKQKNIPSGIFQPAPPQPIQILDSVGGPVLEKDHSAHYGRIVYAVLPFAVVAFLFVIALYKNRNISSEERAKGRSKKAYKQFLTGISPLEKRKERSASFYRDLGRNIHTFLEERFSVTAPELNNHIIEQLIESQKITRNQAEVLSKISEEIDYRRYSSAEFDPEVAKSLLKRAKEVLRKC